MSASGKSQKENGGVGCLFGRLWIRAFVPLVSVNVKCQPKDTRNSATDQSAPKVPRRGPFAGGRRDDDLLGPKPHQKMKASGGAITVYRGRYRESVYRHSAGSVSGCSGYLQIGGAV